MKRAILAAILAAATLPAVAGDLTLTRHDVRPLDGPLTAASTPDVPASSRWNMDAWTGRQKVAYAATLAANIIDWGQTRTIARNPDKWSELNPILGKHPSVGRVNTHFLMTTAALAVLPHVSKTYRTRLMGSTAIVLSINAARNAHLGIRMDF